MDFKPIEGIKLSGRF